MPVKNIASSLLDELFNNLKKKSDHSVAELIWIYETIAKETTWIFSSIVPEKAFEVLMYKVALRRSFFNQKIIANDKSEPDRPSSSSPILQKNEQIIVPKELTVAQKLESIMSELSSESNAIITSTPIVCSAPTSVVEEKPKVVENRDLTWEGFLNDLGSKSPASASNLEQGNTLSPVVLNNGHLAIELGFGFAGQVFMDYLNEPEVYQKVLNNLSEYFNIEQKNIKFELKQVTGKEDFVTQAEIRENQANANLKDRVDEFKNNPLLKKAEELFNSKVDKVVLDNSKK